MAKEINKEADMTPNDTFGIREAMGEVCSILGGAGLTYHETGSPESSAKPHLIVPMYDTDTGNAKAICSLFVSARTENADSDPINVAKILVQQRDTFLAAGLQDKVVITGIACFPNLSADRHALHRLNQIPENTLYKEDIELYQSDPSAFAARLWKCVAGIDAQLTDQCPFRKQSEGMNIAALNEALEDYYQSEIKLFGKSGERYVNDSLCGIPDSEICFISPYCIDDSDACDHVVLDRHNGYIIVETKNWRDVISVSKSHVQLADDVFRRNPERQLARYKERLSARILQKYPYYSGDDILQCIRCVIWLPQVEYCPEIEAAFDTPVIFRGEGDDPQRLLEKLRSLFPESEPLTEAVYLDYRRILEPAYKPSLPIEGDYSELRVWEQNGFSSREASKIIKSWTKGTKQIHFFQNQEDLEIIRNHLANCMAERKISVNAENAFELNFSTGSDDMDAPTVSALGRSNYIQLFRFEAYVLPSGQYAPLYVLNGMMTDYQKAELLAIQNRQIGFLSNGIDCGVFSYEQFEAEHCQTNCNIAVGAGAGTGKTYLLMVKIAYLVYYCSESGITSLLDQIVMLTFTNKAADNMRRRIKGMLFSFFVLTGNSVFMRCIEELAQMQILTIDSFFEKLIQENPTAVGMGSDCSVTISTFKYCQILDEKIAQYFPPELDHAYYDADIRNAVGIIGESILSKGTNVNDCIFQFPWNPENPVTMWLRENLQKILSDTQAEFETYLRERNQLLLSNFSRDALACIISEHFNANRYDIRYVFVDEFQDTSDAQIAVLQAFQSKLSFHIFIVGDPKQSIYGFRDASTSAFDKMMADPDKWKMYRLTINRRSTNTLINYTNQTCADIYQMTGGMLSIFEMDNSELKSVRNTEAMMQLIPLGANKTVDAANEFVAVLKNLRDEQPELFKDAVILARTNTQVQMLTAAANRAGLHVEAVSDHGSGDYYSQPPVLDLYFLLSALTHPRQAIYLFALLQTNFFRVGQLRENTEQIQDFTAMNAIISQTDNLMSYLGNILKQQDAPEQVLRDFLQDGHISYHVLRGMCEKYLSDLDAKKYAPFYPNALGEDSYTDLVEIINGCLAKYASDEPYLHDWESLCRETSNTGNATSLLKILYELFALTQPWKNYSRQDEKEKYIANFKKLFEEIAEAFCHQQMTLDGLYETLKLKILTHQQKEAAVIERQTDAVKCMTIHKSKGLEFDTVFLFAGNTTDWAGNNTLCTLRHMGNGKSLVCFRMQLQRFGTTGIETIVSPYFTAATDTDEEWRVLYVALTRAENNLIVSYIDRQDFKRNQWNLVFQNNTQGFDQEEYQDEEYWQNYDPDVY